MLRGGVYGLLRASRMISEVLTLGIGPKSSTLGFIRRMAPKNEG